MEHQLTVRLPDDLNEALEAASQRMQRKTSDIVRLALREFLGVHAAPRQRHADRVQSLLGSLESGVLDLAENHREYILRSIRRGR